MSKVLYEASPSMVRMNPLGTLLMILLLLLGVVLALAGGKLFEAIGIPIGDERIVRIIGMVLVALGFLRLVTWWVATKIDRLVIKEDEVVWTHGLINKQYTEISMGSVRTVRVSQGFLQRVMNAGDIAIFTSGDIPELVVKGLPNPDSIRDFIKSEG